MATYTAMDPDGTAISWSLAGDDADVFHISSDGVLTFKESPPDYEMPADTDHSYMITVNASAGTDMDSLDVTVTVTDVDEVPTIAGDATIDYAENGTGDVATYTAMDPEEASDLHGRFLATDAGVFGISGAGVLTFNESPDYEMPADADTDNIYMVTVEASAGTNMASHPRRDRDGHGRGRSADVRYRGRVSTDVRRERHGRRGDLSFRSGS